MKLPSLLNKLSFLFRPFGWFSNTALRAAGYRNENEGGQDEIPLVFGVRSAILLGISYVPLSFLLMVILDSVMMTTGHRPTVTGETIVTWWIILGVVMPPLQVLCVLRNNRRVRRRRSDILERKAKRDYAAIEPLIPAPCYEFQVREQPVSLVSQGNP